MTKNPIENKKKMLGEEIEKQKLKKTK